VTKIQQRNVLDKIKTHFTSLAFAESPVWNIFNYPQLPSEHFFNIIIWIILLYSLTLQVLVKPISQNLKLKIRIMKNFIVFLMVVLTCSLTYAQKLVNGNLSPLKSTKKVTVVFDFSKANVEGIPIEDFRAANYIDERGKKDWEQSITIAYSDTKGRFLKKFNKIAMDSGNLPFICLASGDGDAVMTFVFKSIKKHGTFCADVLISNGSQQEPFAVLYIISNGGHIGSFTNLLGDACEDAGSALAKYFKKQLK
jgi:hypothetical protein